MNDVPQTLELMFGSVAASRPNADDMQLVMLVWGKPGCGKTTLAATAPGTKLYLMFDNKGEQPLANRDDILVVRLAGQRHTFIEGFRNDNPFNLTKILADHPEIETIVVDSLTTMSDLALENAVSKSRNSTMELPGQNGYAARNVILKRAMTTLLRVCENARRNIVFIAHEGAPRVDENGVVSETPPILTEGAVTSVAAKMSEIWWMQDNGKQRKIAVRPMATRKFVKSRMFDTKTGQDFVWDYDADNMKGDGIQEWLNKWKVGGGHKLALPK